MWAGKRALPLSTVSAQSRCSDPPLTALREQATASIFAFGSHSDQISNAMSPKRSTQEYIKGEFS